MAEILLEIDFGLFTSATTTVSVQNIKLDEEEDLRMNFCCFGYAAIPD